jgi:hypothetical protein
MQIVRVRVVVLEARAGMGALFDERRSVVVRDRLVRVAVPTFVLARARARGGWIIEHVHLGLRTEDSR